MIPSLYSWWSIRATYCALPVFRSRCLWTATLSVFVGATAPVERDTSPGEERPDWVDENTCEIEFFEGLPLPLEAVDSWCYYCGAPFDQFTIFTFCPLCREQYCPECVDDASRHGFFCRDSFWGESVSLHSADLGTTSLGVGFSCSGCGAEVEVVFTCSCSLGFCESCFPDFLQHGSSCSHAKSLLADSSVSLD